MRFLLASCLVAFSGIAGLAQTNRTTDGLQVLYQFDEGQGELVHDQSGVGKPLDLKIADAKKTKWSRGFLALQSESVLRSQGAATKVIEAVQKSNAITIEAWIRSSSATQTGPARIVSLSGDPSNRNATLGQQADTWELRLRTTTTSENGIPALSTPSSTAQTQLAHVVATRDATGTTTIFVDGKLSIRSESKGDLSNWDANYPLLIANEATSDRAWLGELHLVAIYDRALSLEEVQQNHAAGNLEQRRIAELLPPAASQTVDFVNDVQPILRQHCFECHATGNEEGGLNLAIKARVMEGGQHGAVLERGNSPVSRIVHLVSGVEEEHWMPPKDNEPLSREQIGILRAWIDQGADWPSGADVLDPRLERAREHWAFQQLRSPQRPRASDGDIWCRTDIDVYIAEQLIANDLAASPPTSPSALARRIHFDLVGLPPTPEQTRQFAAEYAADPMQPAAKLVDQLLDSQQYGERWGRHWLDLVRFADSDGQESDRDRPNAYRYRDFVIRALNDDMPFDQFVRWQIAGDEYEPNNAEAVAATGFLTGGTHSVLEDKFLEEERLFNRYNELDDVVSTLGSSLLGLTVGCARCHDHKYDAFSAREYYRLMSAFHSGDRKEGVLPDGSEGLFFQDYDTEVRTTWLFRRSDFFDRELEVKLGFPAILSTDRDAEQYWKRAKAAVDNPTSTLQRRALADWITDVEDGAGSLLARVIVNRVWQHHFGHGLVRTPSDFGVRSDPPSHPELLEYLASDLVAHGWKLKRLHRLILNSAVWQQSDDEWPTRDGNQIAQKQSQADPENRLLWKMKPQRLEAEALRDAMLSVSGTLNLEPFGPGFKPYIPPEANTARNLQGGNYPTDAPDDATTRRRSVYMFHKRLVPYPLFQAFDRPDLLVGCARRQNTTVAPQAMALLNDRFVRACAGDFAKRLIDISNEDAQLVKASFEFAFSRPANDPELESAVAFIRAQSQARQQRGETDFRLEAVTDYCQSLFGLNEFIYVD